MILQFKKPATTFIDHDEIFSADISGSINGYTDGEGDVQIELYVAADENGNTVINLMAENADRLTVGAVISLTPIQTAAFAHALLGHSK